MLKSMTGFGTGRARAGEEEISVEVRAVNHKHLEVKVRLPRELSALEPAVLQAVRARCVRGAVDVAVRRSASTASGAVPTVDQAMARAWREALRTVARAAELADVPTAAQIANQPGVVRMEEPVTDLARGRGRAGAGAGRGAGRAGGDARAGGSGAGGGPRRAAGAGGDARRRGRGAGAEDGGGLPGPAARAGGGAPEGCAGGRGAAGAGGGALRRADGRGGGGHPAPGAPRGVPGLPRGRASRPAGGWTSSSRRCTGR